MTPCTQEAYHWSQVWALCEDLKFPCGDFLLLRLLGELGVHLDALEEMKAK